MRINAQQRADSKPFSDEREPFSYCDYVYMHNYQTKQTLSTVGSQLGSLPFLISGNTAIHWSIFLPILLLKRIYSLSSYTWSSLLSSHLIPYATYVRDVSYFLPYLHVLQPGAPIRNQVQHTAAVVWRCICAKGLIYVTATSFILVIYMRWFTY